MDVVTKDVKRLVRKELANANRNFRMFASPHEGWAVIREEMQEAETEMILLKAQIDPYFWNCVRANKSIPKIELKQAFNLAVRLAVEAIQCAAMVLKYEHSQHRGWPGGKEPEHGEEKRL